MKPARFLHLVAHRGDAAGHPENTLPAFRSALDLGVRFIEVDTQLSANGVPVVVRDHMVMSEAGPMSVTELTAAEISKLDASDPQRFGERFAGTCIPRLVDVLSLLTKRPETTVFVSVGRASVSSFGHDQVIAQIAEALKPFRARCIVISADLPAVHRARQTSGFAIGWVISALDTHTRIKFEALQPEYLFCDRGMLPPGSSLPRGPWRWVVRDVMTLDVALDLAARGADFVATQDARALGEAMRAHAATLAPPRNPESTIAGDDTTIARTTLVPRTQPPR
jgi:glycerophosphoryl diester phosphodiesterase